MNYVLKDKSGKILMNVTISDNGQCSYNAMDDNLQPYLHHLLFITDSDGKLTVDGVKLKDYVTEFEEKAQHIKVERVKSDKDTKNNKNNGMTPQPPLPQNQTPKSKIQQQHKKNTNKHNHTN